MLNVRFSGELPSCCLAMRISWDNFGQLGMRLGLLMVIGFGSLESLAFPTSWLARALCLLLEFGCTTSDTECVERLPHFFRLGRHDDGQMEGVETITR